MSLDAKAIGLLVWKIIRFSACCTFKFVRKYPIGSGFLIFLLFLYICFPYFFYILLYASPILVCTAIFIRFYWKTNRPKVQVVTKKESDEISSGDVNRSNEEKSCPDVNKSNEEKSCPDLNRLNEEKSCPDVNKSNEDKSCPDLNRSNKDKSCPDVNRSNEEKSCPGVNRSNEEKSCPAVNRSNEEKSRPAVNKSNGPSLRPHKSVRRNARKAVLPFDRNDSPNLLFSRSIYDILPGKSNLLEEDSGSVSDETGNDQALHEPNSLFDNERLKPRTASGDSLEGQSRKCPDDGCGKIGGKSLQERENTKDGEVKEDRNKAVEWTKDDEKNLMDLGLTEMERNKRLESLIAKRRARKMFKMAIEKSLMDKGIVPSSQIAPILIVKNNILSGSSNPNEERLPMPGSVPSILLPTQNPFDLPYYQFEEKPNLTADSFQQEFIPANQKETLFCRHESFSHGPLFTFQTSQDRNNCPFNPYYSAEKNLVEGPAVDEYHELKRVPDDEGCHHQHNDSLGFGSEIDVIEIEESNDEAMNSSEEKTEKIRETGNDKTEIGETHDLSGSEVMEIDSIKNNDSCYSASSSDDSASGLDQTTKPLSLCTSQVRKAFNLSIPPKGKTVSKHPNDSSPSPRRTEFNLFYNSYKRHGHHTRNCSRASDLQVEVSEVGSPTLLTDGTISPVEGDSVTYDGDAERDVNSDGEELWGDSFNLSRETNREKLRELDYIIEEDSVAVKLSGLNEKPEEPIVLIPPTEQEAKQILNTASALPSRLDTTEDGASYPTNINRETRDVIRIGEEDNGYKHGNIETSYESKRITESEEKMEERQPSKYIKEDTRNLTKQGTGDAPNAVQSRDDLESVPESLANQNIAESNVSGVEQRLESSSAMALNRRLAIEQTYHSSCASPRSVLPQNILEDRILISNVEQQRQTDLRQSVMEDIERNNSADNQPNHNSAFNMPPITQQSAENSIDHSSSSCSPGTSEGSSNMTKKSINGSVVHIMNGLVLEDTHGKEDSSLKSSNDESKTLTSSNDAKELSKLCGESNPDCIEPIGGSDRLIEYNTRTDPSKSKEGNVKSNDPKTMVKEKSAAEVDRICNVNDSSTDKVTKNGSSTHVFYGEGEPPMLSRQKVVMEPSKTSETTSAGSVKDTEHESKRLTEAEANAELSTSKGVSKSLNNTKNGGDIQTLSGQERVSDALQSREDTLKAGNEIISGVDNNVTGISVDHKIALEASKLKEPEVKAVNTKNGGDIQTLSGQECVSDALQSSEDNLKAGSKSISGVDNNVTCISVDHKIVMEASKLKES